ADQRTVYTISRDKTVRVWRDKDSETLTPRPEGAERVLIAASPKEAALVVTCGSSARLYDGSSGSDSGVALTHEREITAVAFSPDGELIVTGSEDQTARIWSAAAGAPVGTPNPHDSAPELVAVAGDNVVATVTGGDTLRLWRAETGEILGDPVK